MKPYNERLPMIDKAIEYHKGKWPTKLGVQGDDREGLFFVGFKTKMMQMSHGPDTDESEHVCNQEEFEQRAKELGYVNGYKWGVEYETNGGKPDLPDDVVVECFDGAEWWGGYTSNLTVGKLLFNTENTEKFRIVDECYKPKGESVSEIPESKLNPENASESWNGGGKPPVGEVCELIWGGVSQGNVEIIAYRNNGNKVVFWRIDKDHVDSAEIPTAEFRPLQSETDKVIKEIERVIKHSGEDIFYQLNTWHIEKLAKYLYEQGYRKTKQMSEDEFVDAHRDKVGATNARELYKLGFVHLDKGGNDE